MSELLSYYQLCPITDEIIGLAEDQDENSVIITLGKKIVYIMQVSTANNTINVKKYLNSLIFILAEPSKATKELEYVRE